MSFSLSRHLDKIPGVDKVYAELRRGLDKVEHVTGLSPAELAATVASLGGYSAVSQAVSPATTALKDFVVSPEGRAKLAAAYGIRERDAIEEFAKDPTGAIERAEKAAARIAELQKTSAGQAILQQEQQLDKISGLTQPFRQVATDTAMPTLSALALGGEVDYQPSELLGRQLESGREGILQNRAAGGSIKSSGTFENLGDLASNLSAEDIGRYEQGNINLLNTGLRAEDILRGAETSVTGAAGNIFSGLGASLNTAQQNIANAELANAQTLGSGISSLSSLALLRGE